ncbi:MAG: hypothetical protein V7K15_08540 [Nostoc sp.]
MLSTNCVVADAELSIPTTTSDSFVVQVKSFTTLTIDQHPPLPLSSELSLTKIWQISLIWIDSLQRV